MKIAIIGYGIEGQALAEYFAKHGHEITVCDLNKKPVQLKNIRTRFGADYLKNLDEFDLVFRSPGIPYLKKEFDLLRARHQDSVPYTAPLLTSLTRYFFEKCPCPIVGVTGTKGKGTTATLLY